MGRLNKISLIGNAGNDAEMRFTPNGDGVASFSMAVGNKYTNREGMEVDDTEWFRISMWGRRAEFVGNYIKKGMQVFVEGRLSSETYQDQAGETKIGLNVRAYDVQIFQDPPVQPNTMQPQYNSMQSPPQSNPVQEPQSNPAQEPQSNPAQEPSSVNPGTEEDPDKLPW